MGAGTPMLGGGAGIAGMGDATWSRTSCAEKWDASSLAAFTASFAGSLKSVGHTIFCRGSITYSEFKYSASSSGQDGLMFTPDPISKPACVVKRGIIRKYQCNCGPGL